MKQNEKYVTTELFLEKNREIDQKINGIAIALVKTQEEVKEIRETMATKMDIQKIMDKVDAFSASTLR
ncbi:MAG: hypothetical protein ACKVQC_04655 [Elusimicrobiota bacterium]